VWEPYDRERSEQIAESSGESPEERFRVLEQNFWLLLDSESDIINTYGSELGEIAVSIPSLFVIQGKMEEALVFA
jgi:hypothetical protein